MHLELRTFKGLEYLEIRGRVDTIHTTASLWSTRILRRVLETWWDLLSLRLQWETNSWCEKLSAEYNDNNNNNYNNNNSKLKKVKGDLSRELRKLWIMNVTTIPIVIGVHHTVTKRLVHGLKDLEIRGRMETIQTTTLLKSARIRRRLLEIWGNML